nr:macrophage mannose receptor 1-like isoform X2 [Etheostoma spectabile]
MQWSLVVFIVMGQWSSTGGQLCDYHFIGQNKNWTEAQKYCRKYHTDLATVSNETDMQRLQQHPRYPSGAWIGLQRDWRWSQSGVEFKDSNWSPGQPDNQVNQENCVVMMNGGWHDDSCSSIYKCICYDERKKTSGKGFHVIDDRMTWREAQRYCRTYYTDLISGVQQLKEFKTEKHEENLWIGLFKDWSWSDGSSFSFRRWDTKNPDLNSDPEKCRAMTTSGGNWSPVDCSEPKTFFCYDDSVILIQKNLTWVEALYYCRDYHGDLVSITNLDQQLWVQERAKKASTPYVWLGLRYTCTLDFWFWVSDETVPYTNWNTSETMGDDCNMCGAMDRGGGHKWVKKIDNENQFNFICSKNSPPQ